MAKTDKQVEQESDALQALRAMLNDKPAAVAEQETKAVPEWKETTAAKDKNLEWKKLPEKKQSSTVVSCIVIDRWDRWHTGTKVDLHGIDTTGFSWGYYGSTYPVLVEDNNGKLRPWYLPDAAGESSSRLYKGANPEGFRNTFRHHSTLMQKLQVGLMVALVFGLFFIMFILTQQKSAPKETASVQETVLVMEVNDAR